MLKRTLIALSLSSLLVASGAHAITIDLAVDVDLISSPNQVIFTIQLEDASDGSPTAINGYTLDYTFDESFLMSASTNQLVFFGGVELPFAPADACFDTGLCSSGNVPNLDSGPVGDLFAVTLTSFPPSGVSWSSPQEFSPGL
jgi:hypothetical protein